jgi:hypothetical protein
MTFWVGLLAVSSVVQTLLVVVALIAGWRSCERIGRRLDTFEREQLTPAMNDVQRAMFDVRDLVGRVRSVDDHTRVLLSGATAGAGVMLARARTGVWPAVALARGLQAALATFSARRARRDAKDRNDEARFVYEGGSHAQQ